MHEPAASVALVESAQASAVPAEHGATIVTRMSFASPPKRAWEGLMFYEQVDQRPPFYLRWLLPVPVRTIGRKSEVGDEARCIYETGHLIKRVTQVEVGRLYAFAVTEQELEIGGGMRLSHGSYELAPRPGGGTEIAATTHYVSRRAPRWLWRRVEAQVCHVFHRHILRAMRREIDGR